MKVETPVLRVRVASRGLQDNLAKLARGVVLELTALVECPESQALRVTEALTDFLACLVRRDTGVSPGQWDHQEHPERTDRGARMERSGLEDWLARVVPEVCLALVVLQDPLDLLVLLEWTGLQVQKETWAHKVNQAHLGSRESQVHRVFQDLKAPLDHLEKKDLLVGQDYLDYLGLMDLLVILERRVHLERKELRVHQVPRVPLVILALVVSRELMESVV